MNPLKSGSFLSLSILIVISSCAKPQSEDRVSQEIRNLAAFAKVYGHVKYFHPSDEARQIDWNKLAIHGAGLVKGAENDEALKLALNSFFYPLLQQ